MPPTLEDLITATRDYHDHIVRDADAERFLAVGAGQRLDEKPRKNWVARLPACMADYEEGNLIGARTQLSNCINAWRDHVGLLKKYWDTNQMAEEHVLEYLGGLITPQEMVGGHDAVQDHLLTKMRTYSVQGSLDPDAFSIGAEQYRWMTILSVLSARRAKKKE